MAEWKITWGDVSFTDDDLTVGDVALASMLSAEGWSACDPTLSPNTCSNLIAAVVARVTQRPVADVAAEVSAAPAVDLFAAFSRPTSEGDPPSAPSP